MPACTSTHVSHQDASSARGWTLPLPRAGRPSDVSADKHGCCKQPSDFHDTLAVSSMCPGLCPRSAAKASIFSTSYLWLYLHLASLGQAQLRPLLTLTARRQRNYKKWKRENHLVQKQMALLPNICKACSHDSFRSLLKCHLIKGLPPSLSSSPEPVPFINP